MPLERTQPRIIPVLDVMNGQVVRAIGGRRDEYRPIVSKLTTSTDPVEVAKALLEASGAGELYVADLDAITGANRSGCVVARLANLRCYLYIDVGLRTTDDYHLIPDSMNVFPVFGSETFVELDAQLTGFDNTHHRVFSLDLRAGELMGDWAKWGARDSRDVLSVVRTATAKGYSELIVLDLACVGTGSGTGTEPLLRAIRDEFPDVDLIAGGGVRNWDDIERLGAAGATGVLVASALHDGTITFPPTSSMAHP
jgi:phosphoribosylformimino-5-aminoimidazole carboxamide ribotide isomerase